MAKKMTTAELREEARKMLEVAKKNMAAEQTIKNKETKNLE